MVKVGGVVVAAAGNDQLGYFVNEVDCLDEVLKTFLGCETTNAENVLAL